MAGSASASALPRLLIISAIDLLLCCFTMGVMLFLVFQPSLRPDRPNALSRSQSVFAPHGQSVAPLSAPVLLIIRNKTNNAIQSPGANSRLTRIPVDRQRQTPDLIVLTGEEAQLASITLQSDLSGRPASADILVGAQGTILNATFRCDADVQIGIDFYRPAITPHCLPAIRTCSINAAAKANNDGKKFEVSEAEIREAHLALLLWPPKMAPTFNIGPYNLCLFERRSFADQLLYAQQCGAKPTDKAVLLPEDIGECVAAKLMGAAQKRTLTATCLASWNWKSGHPPSGILLGILGVSGNSACENISIEPNAP